MVENYYDDIAEGYDNLYGEEQLNKLKIIKENIKINNDTRILDVGCGSGISSDFECHVTGIDPSKNLIAIAKKKNRNSQHSYLVLKGEDIKSLDSKDKEFDYIISISAIHHVQNIKDLMPELKRIGKKFVFTLLNRMKNKETIINIINNNFNITKTIDEDKDVIIFFE